MFRLSDFILVHRFNCDYYNAYFRISGIMLLHFNCDSEVPAVGLVYTTGVTTSVTTSVTTNVTTSVTTNVTTSVTCNNIICTGQPLTTAECKELIASADKDEDNCMSFYEFVIMVKSERKNLGEDDQSLREAFNLFDKNGKKLFNKKNKLFNFRNVLIEVVRTGN